MKNFLCIAVLLLGVSACNTAEKKDRSLAIATENPLVSTPLETMANAHGFEHWPSISKISFTFNVDRGESHFERSWIWETKNNRVTRIMEGDTVSYLRSEVDSALTEIDAGFINDKYWFLAPYQWVWDQESFTYTVEEDIPAPISGIPSKKLTIVYGDQGGYTPGDAYDFFIGEDSLVTEWIFRKGNQEDPSLVTSWEDYQEHKGLKLSTMHRNADDSFKLSFTGISVE